MNAHSRPLIEHYVLCIGMDDWASDARTMGDLFVEELRYPPEHVHILNKGKGPTRKEVLDDIASFNTRSFGPKDVFILFYSGHGSLDDKGRFMFNTRDGKMSRSEMMEAVARLGPQNAVFIIDACYSGRFQAFDENAANISTAVLAASRSDERVWTGNHKQSFTDSFRDHCKALIEEKNRVDLFSIANAMGSLLHFSSHQWNNKGLSIGPLSQVSV